ncbi:MAG: tetratricopeptide repeat protein [Magnetococcales bacterium]|nr:tetratricopeptide repeat protein [Magnetococcales bacterium]
MTDALTKALCPEDNACDPSASRTEGELVVYFHDATVRKEAGTDQVTARVMMRLGRTGPCSVIFDFEAPLGPIEAEEVTWYLERYHRWPGEAFRYRAKKVEAALPVWGKALYEALFNVPEMVASWQQAEERTLTLRLEDDPSTEGAARLFALPWELLHDDRGFLLEATPPVRLRRQFAGESGTTASATQGPLRVLLLSPRPEEPDIGYINHRVTAKPLAKTLKALGDRAEFTLLPEPTLTELVVALKRAKKSGRPFHVVHFDGHGTYLAEKGQGALCFEAERQQKKLVNRQARIVSTAKLHNVLKKLGVPFVFLEACKSGQAGLDATASVAGAFLHLGAGAVAAMSHSVLVVTAEKLVTEFYARLARGATLSEAMVAGQRHLFDDRVRGYYLGAGRLELQDWFVPQLYQQAGGDCALVAAGHVAKEVKPTADDPLPTVHAHEFVGRSRKLLTLERLFLVEGYAVLLGEGGEGKTALAVEAAHWLRLIGRVERVAFVSLEDHKHLDAVLDQLGKLLAGETCPPAALDREQAIRAIEGVLKRQSTLLVLDNMETVLPPRKGAPSGAYDEEILWELLTLFQRLMGVGQTRLLFTSREELPVPFANTYHYVSIGALEEWDAVEMVREVLQKAGVVPAVVAGEDTEETLLNLVRSVRCHARTLALLAPDLARDGLCQTTETLHQLMRQLHEKYPNDRERSLYAGVALALNRLSPETRRLIRPLGVLQGGGHLGVIGEVLGISDQDRLTALATELAQSGLCQIHENGYLTFHFALCPFLWGEMPAMEREATLAHWLQAEAQFLAFLHQQHSKDSRFSANLTLLDLDNHLFGLEKAAQLCSVEQAIEWAGLMATLLKNLNRKSAQQRVATIQQELEKRLGDGWSHTHFDAAMAFAELLEQQGHLNEAMVAAQRLLQQSQSAGETAYETASYDLAVAYHLAGRYSSMNGNPARAMADLNEALSRFTKLGQGGSQEARHMIAAVTSDLGDCCLILGQPDQAELLHQRSADQDVIEGNLRGVAVSKMQLGMVYWQQKRYKEALQAYAEAQEEFSRLNEPNMVAVSWHKTGEVYQEMQFWQDAEDAYRKSLQIKTQQGNPWNMVGTLSKLGTLFADQDRSEEAAVLFRKALEISIQLQNKATEGGIRNNLAYTLLKLNHMKEARQEIQQAIKCKVPFGHAAALWKCYDILARIESADNQPKAAAEARRQARRLFAQYRRDGGENHDIAVDLCHKTAATIQNGAIVQSKNDIMQIAQNPNLPSYLQPLFPVLNSILDGNRDPALADTPGLDFDDAVEVELLLEQLAKPG